MKKSILIVEDDGIIAFGLQSYLSSLNYIVLGIAKDGETAIEMTQNLKPDLIIMDIIIQGNINGVETCKNIKSFSSVPIIFLTGNCTEIINNEKNCLGMPIYSKPILMEDLKIAIDNILINQIQSKL